MARDNRLFVNASYLIVKTGISWCDLPPRFGQWYAVYHRYHEWCKKGVLNRVMQAVQDANLEWLMLDSTVIRAHQHTAGLNQDEYHEDMGRSRGRFGTKIHLTVVSLGGEGIRGESSSGQDADIKHVEESIENQKTDAAIGDKGYDSDGCAEAMKSTRTEAMISPRKDRVHPREYDKVIYKERNQVERYINLLKQYRRVATRYEKRSRNFLGMVLFAAMTIWLK